MSIRESKIESDFVKYAKGLGCRAYKWVSPGQNGVADRIIAATNGRLFLIEFKAPGKKLGPAQARQKVRLNRQGIPVYTCDNFGQAEEILDAILKLPAITDWPEEGGLDD